MKLEGAKINFLGDSITEGYGADGEEFIYTSLIQKKYKLAAARNYGIGGSRFADQAHKTADRHDHMSFCLRATQMDEDADAVVVFGGTNDFGHSDRPIGSFADTTEETFYGACRVLMERLICRYPGKPIVFLTPLHRCNEDDPWGDGSKAHPTLPLSGYVSIIKEVAAYYALPVLDLYATSGLQPCVPLIKEQFVPDGLHPNNAGHAILAERIAGFLQAL